ncbi:hypothetical protein [Streptantibioticus ferralitis]|uniref:Uncharacterized protein n=1 Tax=Streptantibioticus ferralitis TaxID=236510 RepID=A0ABT5Z7A4_9ACTN|nr:hypothetical protein [Streptantibioticus ferralitis]MDF2259709.1 hypothetical protein [Streptantibioticus ferralitis]
MKDFELDGWDDEEASTDAATSLTRTAARVEEERQALTEQALAERITAAVNAARPGVDKIPDPVDPAGTGNLTADEQERLDACVAGIELLSTATWVAGKSLDTVATGRLFRKLVHKLEPERCYTTIEEWAEIEHGISRSRCSQLRDGWQIGEVLNARGYKAPEGQVRELVPFFNRHGLKAAVGVYEMVVQAIGADKVTAKRLRETVKLFPGDLALSDEDDVNVIAQSLAGAIEGATPPAPKPSTALPTELKREVDRRSVALADRLDRGRIPRNEVLTHLLAAFADERDSRVFDVVFERMKTSNS